jgi:peptidoglycan/LPS O-acetylase OafA/YrhL
MTNIAPTENRNNFTLFRLILASLVIVSHSFELVDNNRQHEPLTALFHTISFGDLAVDFFFVLSGFLIAKSYLSSKNAIEFVIKRALRLYPGFIVATLIGTFVIGYYYAFDQRTYFTDLNYAQTGSLIVKLISPVVPPTLLQVPRPIINGSLWTIRYEAICYGVVLVLGLTSLLKQKWVILSLFFATAFLYLLNCLHGLHPAQGTLVRFIAFFLAGTTYFHFQSVFKFRPLVFVFLALVTLAAMVSPVLSQLALLTSGTMVFFYLGQTDFGNLTKTPLKVDISYGTYLYGWPIQQVLIASFGVRSSWLLLSVSLPLAMIFGYLSWTIVESPVLELKRRISTWK